MKYIKIFSVFILFVLAFAFCVSCSEPNENGEGGETPNGEGETDPNKDNDPNKDKDPEPFVKFKTSSVTIYVDFDYELEYDTNYDGEITLSTEDDDMIWLDGSSVAGLEVGLATVKASFEKDGITYSDEITLNIVLKTFFVTIEDEVYIVTIDTTMEEFLTELYGEKMHPEKEGLEFVDWYFDSDFKKPCHSYNKVNDDMTLYPKYKKFIYGATVNNVYGYRSGTTVSGNVIAFSPAYDGDFASVDLSSYNLVGVRYNPKREDYFVVSKDEKKIYYDGFLIGIKKGSEEETEYLPKFVIGGKVWLDNYSINKTTKIYFDHEIDETVSTVNLTNIDADYVCAYDVTNKKALGSKNGTSKAYPASTTKIITAMAALKYCPVTTTYTIGAELDLMKQGSSPSTAGLKKGQTWTLAELLYATLLPSGNDAAYSVGALTIEYLYPGNTWTIRERLDKFAELMNEVAIEAGAEYSHFMVPDGNSYYTSGGSWDIRLSNHYVCADDMVKIARYAFSFGEIAEVVSTVGKSFSINGSSYNFTNTNQLLNPGSANYYPGTVGMKTGTTTPAGQCVITAVYKDDRFIIVAVLHAGSSGRYSASRAVYDLVFAK